MAENKGIKFEIKVDETSFARTSRMIADLTQQLKELARVAGGISMPGAGGGGGGMLSGIGVTTQRQAGIPTASPMQGANNVAGILTQGLQADRNLFRTIAEGSKEAMKAMRDGLKQTADEQIRDIKRLKKELDDLAKSYNSINDKGGLGSRLAAGDMSAMMAKGRELQSLQSQHATVQRAMGGMGGGGFGAELGGHAMMLAGGAGMALGLARAGIGIHDNLFNRAQAVGVANYEYQGSLPLAMAQARAAPVAALGGLGRQMYQGDIGLAGGFRSALQTGLMQHIANAQGLRETAIRIATTPNIGQNIGNVITAQSARLGIGPNELRGAINELTPQEIERGRQMLQAPGGTVEQAVQGAQARAAETPMWNMWANNYYQNSSGMLGLQRAFGGANVPGVTRLLGRLGFDPGAGAAAVQQAQELVGRGNLFKGLGFLGKQFGGFAPAGEVFALGQEFGGRGGGQNLLNAFAGRGGIAGRGGLDPVAAAQLAQSTIAQTRGGSFGLDPTAAIGGMGALIGGVAGGDIGLQMRMAKQMQMGVGFGTSVLSGGVDPWQQGINAFAGIKAFGNNFQAATAMTRMNPQELNQILLSGNVGDILSSKGVTIEGVRRFAAEQDRSMLSRFIDKGQNTTSAEAVRGARAAGGSMAFLRQQLQGLTGKERANKFNEITNRLGSGLADSLNISDQEAIASVRLRAVGEGLFGRTRGRGVGDPTDPASLMRQIERDKAEKGAEGIEAVEKDKKKFAEDMAIASQSIKPLVGLGESLMTGEKTLAASLSRLAEYIDTVILKRPRATSPVKGAAPRPKTPEQATQQADELFKFSPY